MALSDIFTVPFLVSLGITLLLVGLLGMFFVQRLQEQNHKMASMLGLVSTMAEELNFIRGRLQIMSYVPQTGGVSVSQQQQTAFFQNSDVDNLIPVSDGDDDSNSEDDDSEEENESEDESEDESEESSVLEFNTSIENIIELNPNDNAQTVKIINFGELVHAQSENENENENEDLEDLEDLDEVQELDDMGELESNDECESEGEENVINFEGQEELTEKITQENLSFIKSIDISNLEEQLESESGRVDYKKMSMTKLKSIALAKGLIQENSKATKNVILKMLTSE
jgi:hypothetical protein